jgi:hypothetical protein
MPDLRELLDPAEHLLGEERRRGRCWARRSGTARALQPRLGEFHLLLLPAGKVARLRAAPLA